ncbi:MAG: hypothetical protein FWC91_05345 [Defluviitaleaceae bacterium]|nr:hypothetical protein [Defluviitaleaceae bacterium]
MSDEKKAKLIKIYKTYNTFEWIIVIAIIATPFILSALSGLGMPEIDLESIIHFINGIPLVIIVPFLIIYMLYTVFCVVLYVKVWPVKEIPKGFTYWFDWILTILITAYELFVFYVILFG